MKDMLFINFPDLSISFWTFLRTRYWRRRISA
jgi:hypothetical protein